MSGGFGRGRGRIARLAVMVLVGIGGVGVAALAAIAVARSFTLEVTKNVSVHGKRENLVSNSSGVTVYELIPETTHHLLCTGVCLQIWPPVTVASAHAKLTKASGVPGKLGEFRRGKTYQVTLGGRPLYRYGLDRNKKGVANGDGVNGPGGGTWHVIRASRKRSSTDTPSTTTTKSTPTVCLYPPYC